MSSLTILSGGQTGVDRGALDAALEAGAPCGGWCPQHRLAEDGRIDPRYPVTELSGGGYADRTLRNVIDSEGTLIIVHGRPDGGTALTLRHCQELGKPHLLIDAAAMPIHEAATEAARFVLARQIARLNVAGPRASKWPSAHGYARALVTELLQVVACSCDAGPS